MVDLSPYWQGEGFPAPQPKRRPITGWPAWDSLVQKLYVLDWEDSDEWFVPPKGPGDTELEREAKLERVKERRKHLKSLVRYNLVQGHVARAIPAKSRGYQFPCRVKKPKDDAGLDYMGQLPSEVVYFIFSFLDPVIDLPRASAVCHLWNAIASDPVFWIQPLRRRDIMGNTVLHLAASSIDEEVALRTCAYFIQRGAVVDVSNRRGDTPLIIATTLGHQALQLFLSRHSERYRMEVRVGWGHYNFEMDELMSIDAYQRVVEFLGAHMQRLYPCSAPRVVDGRSEPGSGFWMHKHLPRHAFKFLRHTREEFRDRPLDRWEVGLVRRRHLKAAAPAPAVAAPVSDDESDADRPPAAAVVRYSALDTQHWLEVKQKRQRERDQRLAAALQRLGGGGGRAKKAPPPRIDHRGTFPPLPLQRGRGRGGRGGPPRGGRGGRGGATNPPSSATTSSSSSSSRTSPWASTGGAADPRGGGRGGGGRGERGRGGGRGGRGGRGGEDGRGRGRGGGGRGEGPARKDKGKEKLDE